MHIDGHGYKHSLALLAVFALSALVGSLFKSLHGGTLILAPVGPAVPTHEPCSGPFPCCCHPADVSRSMLPWPC